MATRPLALFAALVVACGGEGPGGPGNTAPISALQLDPVADTIRAFGDTARVTATVRRSDNTVATGVAVTWTSRAPTIATVSDGLVTSVSDGSARVVAEINGGFRDSVTVWVRQRATGLAMSPVFGGEVGIALPVVSVRAIDARQNTVASFQDSITVTLTSNARAIALEGKIRQPAVAGTALFDSLVVPKGGQYTLTPLSGSLTGAASHTLDVLVRFVSIGGISFHTCGLATDGDTYCWGRNQLGGLGNGTAGTNRAYPSLVTGDLVFIQVAPGSGSAENGHHDGFGCGIRDNGGTYCWGRNGFGQIGNTAVGAYALSPVAVAGSHAFIQLVAGRDHACGRTATGEAWCWGRNTGGQIGDGTYTQRNEPVQVSGGLQFTELAAGNQSTCGITDAADAYCWAYTPQIVPGGLDIKQIAPGTFSHSCAVTTSDDAYCWGYNHHGELGGGNLTGDSPTPVLVVGGHKYRSVGAGSERSCGLTTASEIYCWGHDMGLGSYGMNAPPNDTAVPVKLSTTLLFETLQVNHQTVCGLTASHAAYCWGYSQFGELGNGTLEGHTPLPARVQAPR